jgi:hypothetical protein
VPLHTGDHVGVVLIDCPNGFCRKFHRSAQA